MDLYLCHKDLWNYVNSENVGVHMKRDQKAKVKVCWSNHINFHLLEQLKTTKQTWDYLKYAYKNEGLAKPI